MTSSEFYSLIKQQFPFEPTLKQNIVLNQLSEFIFDKQPNALYLLKGYAGTGKTTIIGVLVKNLWQVKKYAVLLAPTGRAAKVISNYSKSEAFTIHKKIYAARADKNGKMVPEKVGMKGVQRDGLDYEFTLVFELNIKQHATATKDRTSLFIDKPEVRLSENEGRILLDWCNQGNDTLSDGEQFSEKIKLIKSVPELRTLYIDNPKFKDTHNNEFIEQKKVIEIERANKMYNKLNIQKNGTNLNII